MYLWWWRSHQSLAREGLRIFRFCVMPWKDEREPTIKFCLGGQVDVFNVHQNTELWTIDGEPMEFEWSIFPGCTTLQLINKVQEFMTKWATHHNSKDELSSCRCSMTSYGDLKTMIGNAVLTPHLCLYWRKDFEQDDGLSSDLDQKRSVVLLTLTNHEESGTESQSWWWSNSVKADTQSIVSRNVQKQRRWKTIYTLLCRTWYDWNCFSHNYFCQSAQYLRSSLRLCKEYSACQTRTARPVLAGQSDPVFEPAKIIDDDTYTFDWNPYIWTLIAKVQGTSGKALTTGSSDKDLYWCIDSWKLLKSDSISWHCVLKNSHNLQSQWHVVSTLYHEMTNQLIRKVGFEGTPKLGPYWKSQRATYKVKLELNLWTDNSHSSIRARISWSRTWATKRTTTTSRKPLKWSLKVLRWKRMHLLFCEPIKG